MEKFKFTPESGFRDGTAYPNPTSEANTREMFQRPLDQLRDYINQLLGIIPTDEQLQQMVTNHDLILELEKAVKQLEENSNSYAEYDEETGNLQINSAMDILALFKQLSNPNLLINSDFRNPVNQRGKTSYWKPSSWTYNVDRWSHILNSVILNSGYIRIYNDTGETGTTYFKQIFEHPLEQNDYTVTVNVKEITGTVQVNDFGTLIKGINVFTVKNTSLIQLQLNLVGESSIELEYIKLEQGSIATPFAPRPYAEELAMCKRYYRQERVAVSYRSRSTANSYAFYIPTPIDVRNANKVTLEIVNGRTTEGLVNASVISIAESSPAWSQCYATFDNALDGYQILVLYAIDAEIY